MKKKFLALAYTFLISMTMYAQSWAKVGTVFHYKGYYEVWDNEDNLLKVDSINDFSMTINTISKGKNCLFIFWDNYFDIGVDDDQYHQFYAGKTKSCIALYKNVLYEVFYDTNIAFNKSIDFKDVLNHKYKGMDYDRQINLLPDKKNPNEFNTNRFSNPYKINQYEKQYFFVKNFQQNGKFTGMVNLYKAVDDKGYFNDTIIYSNKYFFTSYHRNVTRTPTPYHIAIELKSIDYYSFSPRLYGDSKIKVAKFDHIK